MRRLSEEREALATGSEVKSNQEELRRQRDALVLAREVRCRERLELEKQLVECQEVGSVNRDLIHRIGGPVWLEL